MEEKARESETESESESERERERERDTDRWIDGPTDRPTDTPSYKVAYSQLKTETFSFVGCTFARRERRRAADVYTSIQTCLLAMY